MAKPQAAKHREIDDRCGNPGLPAHERHHAGERQRQQWNGEVVVAAEPLQCVDQQQQGGDRQRQQKRADEVERLARTGALWGRQPVGRH